MKTEKLYETALTEDQQENRKINLSECHSGKTKLKAYPRRIVLELTNRCNFRCIMCGRQAKHFQPFDMEISMITRLESIYPYVEEVTLHGWGEGTLHPRFIEILQYLNSYPLLRKYFVTNGSTLPTILQAIFDYHVDLVAVSLDGATATTNNSIRRGGDFDREIAAVKQLVQTKIDNQLNYPYVNLVFTAMRRNISELPDLITLAGEMNVPEVKVVYLTVFDKRLLNESLVDRQGLVQEAFDEATKRADEWGINLKLPEIQGKDETGAHRHKLCPFPWRDLYVGSDGFVRICQSSSGQIGNIMAYESFDEAWNSEEMQMYRKTVNDEELMPGQCFNCYHSTCANWNMRHSFIQVDHEFGPGWGHLINK